MDKLRALRTLIAIVDRGSLTSAADALGSSLPATVRSLAGLESELGVRLLNRTTRRLSLTEDGRQYLERARGIVAELDDADRAVGAGRSEPAGPLRVTAPVLYGQYHVAPAVTRFLQRYPRVQVRLLLLDRVVNLIEEGLDVGIRIGPLQDSSLVAHRVAAIRRVVVASPELLRRLGTPRHPRELAALPCLRFHNAEAGTWTFVEKVQGRPKPTRRPPGADAARPEPGGRRPDNVREFKVAVQGPLQCNLAGPVLQACAESMGFARVLSYQAAPLVAEGRLRIVLEDYEVEAWPVHLSYPSARLLPSRVRVFIDAMKQQLSQAS